MNEDKHIHDTIQILLNIIYEYMNNMENSDFFLKLENNVFLLSIGFRMMIHIFQLNYIYAKNIEEVYFNCQKSYYYYLEYLEQMYTTNMCQELNYENAIIFVYKKNLIKCNNNSLNSVPSVNSIENNFIKKMSKITKLLNTLFWWENPSIQTLIKSPKKSSDHSTETGIPQNIILNILNKHYVNEHYDIQETIEDMQKTLVSRSEYINMLTPICQKD